MTLEIEDFHKFINSPNHIRHRKNFKEFLSKFPKIDEYTLKLLKHLPEIKTKQELNSIKQKLEKEYKYDRIKSNIMIYQMKKFYWTSLITKNEYEKCIAFLQAKKCRSLSGILEVAVMTSPENMSGSNDGCDYNCYFCPKQKGFARSYIKDEPMVRRASQFDFDPVKQVYDRLSSYMINGHDIDKLEILVLGGTWSSYEDAYHIQFITSIYYAANTFYIEHNRPMKSLKEEQEINMTSLCKVIGLTIETRPDQITEEEIQKYNNLGVTRVQLGVQITNDYVLKKINRGCYNKDTIKALYLLKKYGFKVLIHLMQNLPFSNPEIDKQTADDIIYNPDFQADELKIYPTSVTTTSDKDNTEVFTVIEKWHQEGKYVPYSTEKLFEVLYYLKNNIPDHIRISRVFRDIPKQNITAGADIPHMRQVIQKNMEERGEYCKCIRCCEIKNLDFTKEELFYQVKCFPANKGLEYHISARIPPKCDHPYKSTLVGFLRLRVNNENEEFVIDSLKNTSIVRELHVYGRMKPSNKYSKFDNRKSSQHQGVGKTLIKIAEKITEQHCLTGINVIAGVGVRKYYENKNGYQLVNNYMYKKINPYKYEFNIIVLLIMIYIILVRIIF